MVYYAGKQPDAGATLEKAEDIARKYLVGEVTSELELTRIKMRKLEAALGSKDILVSTLNTEGVNTSEEKE